MVGFRKIFLPAILLIWQPLHAEVDLDPVGHIILPVGHSYNTGLSISQHPISGGYRLMLSTIGESWQAAAYSASPSFSTQFIKIFDSTLAGVRMYEDSLTVYQPGADRYIQSGGLFDYRFYNFDRNTGITSSSAMLDLEELPRGMAVRDTLIGGANGSTQLFVSTRNGIDEMGNPGSSFLALYSSVANTDQHGILFGNTGPGAVSSGVGALAFGPDGLLNVLDTGRQQILRYDPDTLAFAGAFDLANSTTNNTSFAITPNGYVFTADLNNYQGTIYDYATGELVGTFESIDGGPIPGNGGKLIMTADAAGYVYVHSSGEWLWIFDSNALPVPEPSPTGLILAATSLGMLLRRRRSCLSRA